MSSIKNYCIFIYDLIELSSVEYLLMYPGGICMSSKKTRKKNSAAKTQKTKNDRLKYMENEDKELSELEEIIAKSKSVANAADSSDNYEKKLDYINDDYLNDESYDDNDDGDFFASLDAEDEKIKVIRERIKAKKPKSSSKFDIKKYLPENISEFISKNTKYVICGSIIGVLTIALIVALAFDRASMNDNTKSAVHTNGTLSKDVLVETKNSEIVELVNNYFTALVEGNLEKLSLVMDSIDGISEDTLKLEGEYIEEYKNVKCYVKDGLNKHEYVIYVYYENKILNINTLAPGAIILYVVEGADGYRIHNNINESEISAYINKLSKGKDVVDFNKEVDNKLDEACEKDTDLKALRDALISSGEKASSDTDSSTVDDATQPQSETVPEQAAATQNE